MAKFNAKEKTPESRFHALFLGDSGCGKTCASVTVGDREDSYSRVFVHDLDDRIKGILGLGSLNEKVQGGFIEGEDFLHSTSLVDDLQKSLEDVEKRIKFKQIDTYILSTTTSMVRAFESEALKCKDIKHMTIKGTTMTQKQDFAYIARASRDLIWDFLRKLPCNVIIEAHLKDIGYNPDGDDNRWVVTGRGVKVPGQLAEELPGWFDETYEFTIDDTIPAQPRYICKFRSRLAKTCFQNLPPQLDWTGKNFFRTITGILNGSLDKNGNPPRVVEAGAVSGDWKSKLRA